MAFLQRKDCISPVTTLSLLHQSQQSLLSATTRGHALNLAGAEVVPGKVCCELFETVLTCTFTSLSCVLAASDSSGHAALGRVQSGLTALFSGLSTEQGPNSWQSGNHIPSLPHLYFQKTSRSANSKSSVILISTSLLIMLNPHLMPYRAVAGLIP